MNGTFEALLDSISAKSRLDLSAYRLSFLSRWLAERLAETGCSSPDEFWAYLNQKPTEMEDIVDSLTVGVTSFFRDPLAFDFIGARLLPSLLVRADDQAVRAVRIWSAGCATGEEPYSLGMLARQLLKEANIYADAHIFATDISEKLIAIARRAGISCWVNLNRRLGPLPIGL